MPNFIDQTDPTDQNADSTGAGMAFLSWLMSQGYSLSQIAQAMVALGDSGTPAQLYANLTGDSASNAFPNFLAAVQALPNGITNDDPFNGAVQPGQLAHLAPWTVDLAGKIFAAILADLAAGKAAHQIVASVRAVMVGAPAGRVGKMPTVQPAVCSIGSHRLVPPGRPVRPAIVANGPIR
jgi:hypothetical protein